MSYSRVSRAPGSGPADSPRGTVIDINITNFNINYFEQKYRAN